MSGAPSGDETGREYLGLAIAGGRRLVFALAVFWLVLTALFVGLEFVPGGPGDAPGSAAAGVDADSPVLDRYTAWMERYATLDWGTTVEGGEATSYESLVLDRLAITSVLLLPALVLTALVAVVAGVYAGLHPGSNPDRVVRAVAYLGFALPSFFVGIVLTYFGIYEWGWREFWYDPERTLWSVYNVRRLAAPSAVLAVGILGVQLRQVRSAALDQRASSYVRLARAKGGGFRTVGRHVFRVTLLPVLSAFLSELLGLLLLAVIAVEVVFQVPGFGTLLLETAYAREPTPIVAVTLVTVAVALGGRLFEDAVSRFVDPRVGESDA